MRHQYEKDARKLQGVPVNIKKLINPLHSSEMYNIKLSADTRFSYIFLVILAKESMVVFIKQGLAGNNRLLMSDRCALLSLTCSDSPKLPKVRKQRKVLWMTVTAF